MCLKNRSSLRNVMETLSRHEQTALWWSFVFAVKRKIKAPGDKEARFDGCSQQKTSGSAFLSAIKSCSFPGEKLLHKEFTCREERGDGKKNSGKAHQF